MPHRYGQLVGLGRFELPTSRLSGVRSNQLSYRPQQPEKLKSIGPDLNRSEATAHAQRDPGGRSVRCSRHIDPNGADE